MSGPSGFKRDITGAMARRLAEKTGAILTQEDVDRAKSDKVEAMRLAQLIHAAAARGAAPAPPGKAAAAPAPVASAEPPKVVKYRCVAEFNGNGATIKKGATVFVIGNKRADNTYQAVFSGKQVNVPASSLVEITDALLEQERIEREKALEALRLEEEAAIAAEAAAEAAAESSTKGSTSSSSSAAPAASSSATSSAPKSAISQEEQERLKAEEARLKAEAARLEALMKALDMDD